MGWKKKYSDVHQNENIMDILYNCQKLIDWLQREKRHTSISLERTDGDAEAEAEPQGGRFRHQTRGNVKQPLGRWVFTFPTPLCTETIERRPIRQVGLFFSRHASTAFLTSETSRGVSSFQTRWVFKTHFWQRGVCKNRPDLKAKEKKVKSA